MGPWAVYIFKGQLLYLITMANLSTIYYLTNRSQSLEFYMLAMHVLIPHV